MKAPSPKTSPLLQPVSEVAVVGEDEVSFSLLEHEVPNASADKSAVGSSNATPAQTPLQGASSPGKSSTFKSDEPAYVMPATPSPFLSAQFAPDPPPIMFGAGFDMGLPPAFGEGAAGESEYYMQGMMGDSSQYMAMGYDPNAYDPAQAAAFWAAMAEGQGWDMEGYENMAGFSMEGYNPEGMSQETMAAWAAAAGGENGAPTVVVEGDDGSPKTTSDKDKADKDEVVSVQDDAQSTTSKSKPAKAPSPPPPEPKESMDAPTNYTTVMLRNIPNKYTREMLVEQLNRDFGGRYDFMYLPIDFKNKCNVGYAFINFRTSDACAEFVTKFNNVDVRKCLPGLNSKKIVEVTPARVQGFTENVRRLRNSPVMSQLSDHPEWMPLLFNDRGQEEAFPRPDSAPPPVKPRGRGRPART